MSNLQQNIEREMLKRAWNPYDLAEASGVSQPTIHRILTGYHKDPKTATVKKIASAFGMSEAELRGLALKYTRQITEPDNHYQITNMRRVEIINWENPSDLPDDQYALIPRFRLSLSAGNGTIVTEELPDAPLAFTTQWLKKKSVKRSKLAVVNAVGDSMEPTICSGALLLVDTGNTEVVESKIYALRYGDQLRVKRLFRRYDGGLIIRSDNQARYPDEVLTKDDLNEHIYIIGRVIWQASDL